MPSYFRILSFIFLVIFAPPSMSESFDYHDLLASKIFSMSLDEINHNDYVKATEVNLTVIRNGETSEKSIILLDGKEGFMTLFDENTKEPISRIGVISKKELEDKTEQVYLKLTLEEYIDGIWTKVKDIEVLNSEGKDSYMMVDSPQNTFELFATAHSRDNEINVSDPRVLSIQKECPKDAPSGEVLLPSGDPITDSAKACCTKACTTRTGTLKCCNVISCCDCGVCCSP